MSIDIDWGAAWKEEQHLRRHADDASFWNMRAPSFAKTAGTSSYASEFLDKAQVGEGESIFDMGCGSGTLSLPLARAGHHVYAADFSEAMLDLMMQRAKLDGVADLIHPVMLAWDEDWSKLDVPVCDVAFASRSIATDDMQSALLKLDGMARRRVCITLSTGLSPRTDNVLLKVIGRDLPRYPDCVFAFNILWGLGIEPDMSYIHSARKSEFESFDAAVDKACEILDANPEERELLIAYSREHLHERTDDDGNVHWEYDHARITSWAFMSWDKE